MCLWPKRIGTAFSTRQNQLSFISRLPKTSCGPIACWILARTSSLVTWSLYEMCRCGMVMSPVHQVLPKPSCKTQWKGEENKADRVRGGKTTSGNGQAWSSASPRGQWRIGENGENWLQNHLWCPNDHRGRVIDDDDNDDDDQRLSPSSFAMYLAVGYCGCRN